MLVMKVLINVVPLLAAATTEVPLYRFGQTTPFGATAEHSAGIVQVWMLVGSIAFLPKESEKYVYVVLVVVSA